ncbi:MAG: lipoyl(octanoyl) transferase LipB [Thermoplasmata archaeon]|jgi:lipoate-protein ligase B
MPAVVEWGRRDYSESLDAMRSMVRARREGTVPDTLILVEHPPVVTVGVEGDDGSAVTAGLPTVSVERGGRATYHGPGQLVGYPIVDLEPRGRDVRQFVHDVEEVVVRSLVPFGVVAGHVHGRRGVWVAGERKIASIGIAVDHWVTFHGFALNVDPDLEAFDRFHPCGFSGSVMTSLSREVGRPVPIAEVTPHIVDAWREVFYAPPDRSAAVGAPIELPPA